MLRHGSEMTEILKTFVFKLTAYIGENFMKQSKTSKIFSIVLFTLFSISLSITADAASSCKGLAKSMCVGDAQCSWVNTYKTKKGTKVKAFCRSKRNSKSVKKKSVTKKVSSKTISKTKGKVAKKSKTSNQNKAKEKSNLVKTMVSQ